MRRIVILAVIGAAVPCAGASAKTLQVDDDRATCRSAAYTSIQPAVNAAASGDVIRVCPGTYAEQVVLPDDKSNLQLRSVSSLQAILRQPAGGIPDSNSNPAAVLVSRGIHTLVRGFRIVGPTSVAGSVGCSFPRGLSAVAIPEGSSTINSNRITAAQDLCPGSAGFAAGVLTGDRDGSFSDGFVNNPVAVLVDRNVIEGGSGNVTGVITDGAPKLRLQRNTMLGAGSDDSAVNFSDDLQGPPPTAFTTFVQDNDISGWRVGVEQLSGENRTLVAGNRLHGNGTGFLATRDGATGEVRGNGVTGNGTGIQVGDDFGAFLGGFLIRNNQVRNNSGDGISIVGFGATNRLFDNTSLGNGGLDCHDETTGTGTAGTNNTWSRNIGLTDSPDVCGAP